ncbi:hypothetical protein GCM10027062_05230 [Nocardioides hungaricus]
MIECDAVGLIVQSGDLGLTIPTPGLAVGTDAVLEDGTVEGFQVEVASDGTISYPEESSDAESGIGYDVPDSAASVGSAAAEPTTEPEPDAPGDPGNVPEAPDASADNSSGSPGACADGDYSTNDLKEYGTYNWYIGDGGMPGALSRSAAQQAFANAVNNITGSETDCSAYSADEVDASASYQGTTSYETDMNSSGDCTDRDEKSTWDAGDLASGTVAQTCWWSTSMPGVKNDLREADVRYNTNDYDFTNTVSSSCSGKYDIRSVGTHEAGHVFGMGHVGSGHDNLTMYTNSFICKTKARTLGKGDVLGLRSIY